jgi:predicted hotdog family 3-hydroxylacyl-ACP dehydratase
MTDCRHIPIETLLLQAPPFRFVDRLDRFDREEVVTSFTVPADGPLVEDGCLTEAGLVENMAQSSAARIGYISVYIDHVPVRIGYLGQIKNLEINRLPRCGEVLSTTVRLRQDVFGITLVEARVCQGEEMVAQAAVKTALRDA